MMLSSNVQPVPDQSWPPSPVRWSPAREQIPVNDVGRGRCGYSSRPAPSRTPAIIPTSLNARPGVPRNPLHLQNLPEKNGTLLRNDSVMTRSQCENLIRRNAQKPAKHQRQFQTRRIGIAFDRVNTLPRNPHRPAQAAPASTPAPTAFFDPVCNPLRHVKLDFPIKSKAGFPLCQAA